MAQRVETLLTDDLDGTEAAQTVGFALDGVAYEIDLNEEHARELREAVEPYVRAARQVGGSRGRAGRAVGAGSVTRRDPAQTKAIRDWATANGQRISERGRIPAEVVAAYEAAH